MEYHISNPPRSPRLGETVFLWLSERLLPGKVTSLAIRSGSGNGHATEGAADWFIIQLTEDHRLIHCQRGDFALLAELRHLIPRMRRPSSAPAQVPSLPISSGTRVPWTPSAPPGCQS